MVARVRCGRSWCKTVANTLQGHLAYKKPPPCRTVRWDYAQALLVLPEGGRFLMSEVPLKGHHSPFHFHKVDLWCAVLTFGGACQVRTFVVQDCLERTLGQAVKEQVLSPRKPAVWFEKSRFYLTKSVYRVVLQKSIPAQIRQLILYKVNSRTNPSTYSLY